MLAADAYFEVFADGTAPLNTEFHEFPHARLINSLKGVIRQDFFLNIVRQEQNLTAEAICCLKFSCSGEYGIIKLVGN